MLPRLVPGREVTRWSRKGPRDAPPATAPRSVQYALTSARGVRSNSGGSGPLGRVRSSHFELPATTTTGRPCARAARASRRVPILWTSVPRASTVSAPTRTRSTSRTAFWNARSGTVRAGMPSRRSSRAARRPSPPGSLTRASTDTGCCHRGRATSDRRTLSLRLNIRMRARGGSRRRTWRARRRGSASRAARVVRSHERTRRRAFSGAGSRASSRHSLDHCRNGPIAG